MELKKKQEDLKRRKKQISEKDLAKMEAELVSGQQNVLCVCVCVFGAVVECREGIEEWSGGEIEKGPICFDRQ